MKTRIILLILSSQTYAVVSAQISNLQNVAQLQVFTAESQQPEVKDCFGNPACLDSTKSKWLGLLSSRSFNPVISRFLICGGIKMFNGHLVFLAGQQGTTFFSEQSLSISYAMQVSNNMQIGSRATLVMQRAIGYPLKKWFAADVGFKINVSRNVTYGLWVMNPLSFFSRSDLDDSYLLSGVRTGFGFDISENWFGAIDFFKSIQMPVAVSGKIRYKLFHKVSFSFALTPMLMRYSLLATFSYRKMGITVGTTYQYRTGAESLIFFNTNQK